MDPKAELQAALKEAMKAKDNRRRDVIRYLQAEIKQMEIDQQKSLSSEEAMAVLQREAKKQREAVVENENIGRTEAAQAAHEELAIMETFLPRQLSKEEITAIVQEVIAEVGATSTGDMGKVMGPVMQRVKGVADGKLVNQVVREQLS